MSKRILRALVGSLALATGVALAAVPAAGAGAAPSQSRAHQHAACAAVGQGYARCLAHVIEIGTLKTHGPGPTATTPKGYSPTTIATAYGFSTSGGTTQTIAIVDAYGASTITSNLQSFSSTFGLPSCTQSNGCFTKVNQTGGTSYPRATSGWALEQSLDVEWAHSLAPRAHILLVEATSASFTNLLAAVRYGAAHANYVSMSWGGTDFAGEATYDSNFTKTGVSYFAASGDTASSVIYPSSSPDVVSVGGTTLTATGGQWKSETAWSTAGGGCSSYETASTAQSPDSAGLCGTHRATPDISLDANPYTGVAVYDTERLTTGQSGWIQVGGTSASTAMIAAHATETAKAVNASTVYGGTLKVYDVTTGSNGHPCTNGYDLCTGVGSWNTAVGTSSGSSGSAGTLSFTPATGQTLSAGSPSGAITVKLSTSTTAAVTVTVSTSTGGLATSSSATSFASSLTVQVPAGSTKSPAFYYESTKAGSHPVTASATNWTSASQTETVTPSTVKTITVTPSSATVAEGGTQKFSASGADTYGNAVTLTKASWNVSSTTLGSVSPGTGSSTTFTAGSKVTTGSVTVTTGGATTSASVSVTATPALTATMTAHTSRHNSTYRTLLTVHVSRGGTPVSGAAVALTIYGGPTCSTVKATGSGTTRSNGTVSFTFQTRSVATFCAVAIVTDGSSSTTAKATFTT